MHDRLRTARERRGRRATARLTGPHVALGHVSRYPSGGARKPAPAT